MTTLEQLHPIKYDYISFLQKKSFTGLFVISLRVITTVCCLSVCVYTLMREGLLTFGLFSPRLSLELLALSGVIVSSLASIWAVQTLSWWFDRLPSTCGRSWCPTPPELFERSSQPSSLFCWASWLPPALTRERYYSFELCKPTLSLYSLVGGCQQCLFIPVTMEVPPQSLLLTLCVGVVLDRCSDAG